MSADCELVLLTSQKARCRCGWDDGLEDESMDWPKARRLDNLLDRYNWHAKTRAQRRAK